MYRFRRREEGGGGRGGGRKAKHFGLDKSVRTSRDRECERKRSLVFGRGRGGLFMAFYARARARTRIQGEGRHRGSSVYSPRLANEISRIPVSSAWPGACAILILRTKFSTLRPAIATVAVVASCNVGTINLRDQPVSDYLYPGDSAR